MCLITLLNISHGADFEHFGDYHSINCALLHQQVILVLPNDSFKQDSVSVVLLQDGNDVFLQNAGLPQLSPNVTGFILPFQKANKIFDRLCKRNTNDQQKENAIDSTSINC